MRFYEKPYVVEYDRRLSAEGYPGNLLDEINKEINSAGTVIDVGAGSGFFAVPLARRGHRIIAIEPSPVMAGLLKTKLDNNISDLIEVNICGWETWPPVRAESLICVHSIYGINELEKAVIKMKECSDKAVVVIGAAEGSCTLSGIIRAAVKERKSREDLSGILPGILSGAGISFISREIEHRRENRFTDIRSEADFYCFWNGIDASKRDIVENIIRENSGLSGGSYVFSGLYRDMLLIF